MVLFLFCLSWAAEENVVCVSAFPHSSASIYNAVALIGWVWHLIVEVRRRIVCCSMHCFVVCTCTRCICCPFLGESTNAFLWCEICVHNILCSTIKAGIKRITLICTLLLQSTYVCRRMPGRTCTCIEHGSPKKDEEASNVAVLDTACPRPANSSSPKPWPVRSLCNTNRVLWTTWGPSRSRAWRVHVHDVASGVCRMYAHILNSRSTKTRMDTVWTAAPGADTMETVHFIRGIVKAPI